MLLRWSWFKTKMALVALQYSGGQYSLKELWWELLHVLGTVIAELHKDWPRGGWPAFDSLHQHPLGRKLWFVCNGCRQRYSQVQNGWSLKLATHVHLESICYNIRELPRYLYKSSSRGTGETWFVFYHSILYRGDLKFTRTAEENKFVVIFYLNYRSEGERYVADMKSVLERGFQRFLYTISTTSPLFSASQPVLLKRHHKVIFPAPSRSFKRISQRALSTEILYAFLSVPSWRHIKPIFLPRIHCPKNAKLSV
jgi:hypothetical protein